VHVKIDRFSQSIDLDSCVCVYESNQTEREPEQRVECCTNNKMLLLRCLQELLNFHEFLMEFILNQNHDHTLKIEQQALKKERLQ
jgi:hypothetical protein